MSGDLSTIGSAIDPDRRPVCEALPTVDRELDIARVDLHPEAAPAEGLGSDDCRSMRASHPTAGGCLNPLGGTTYDDRAGRDVEPALFLEDAVDVVDRPRGLVLNPPDAG